MANINLSLPYSNVGSLPFTFPTPAPVSFDYTLEVSTWRSVTLDPIIRLRVANIITLNYTLEVSTFDVVTIDYPLLVRTWRAVTLDYTLQVATSATTRRIDYALKVRMMHPVALDYTLQVSTNQPTVRLDYPLRVSLGYPVSFDYTLLAITRNLGARTFPGDSYLVGDVSSGSVNWTLQVLLGGVDVSHYVTGTVTISAEVNAARLADFSLLPSSGFTSPFNLTGKSVQIAYKTRTASGSILSYRLRFVGIVDKPSVNLDTGILSLGCTDNLQKSASLMTKAALKELVTNSSWSSFVFQKPKNNWEYAQNLLETTPVALYIPPGGNITCRDMWVDGVLGTANETVIVDGSLSVELPSITEIINAVTVTVTIEKTEFKEQIASLNWGGETGPPSGAACGVQQIFDAVASAGAKFVAEPTVMTLPPSRFYTQNFQTVAVINSGNELLCASISGAVSRRFTQPTTTVLTYVIENKTSINTIGRSDSRDEYTIPVVLDTKAEEWFLQEETVTRWWATAGGGQGTYTQEESKSQFFRPGDGAFEPYPSMAATFPIWIGNNPLSSDLQRAKANNKVWTVAGTSEPTAAGSFAISTKPVTAQGTPEEIEEAIYCAQAKARTLIERSHRKAVTNFSLIGWGLVELCEPILVSTRRVETKGVVVKLVEEANIDTGSILSKVTTASSLTKAIGLRSELETTVSIDVALKVSTMGENLGRSVDYAGLHPFSLVSDSLAPPDLSMNVLGQHFYLSESEIQPEWYGHIAPSDALEGGGKNIFVLPWATQPSESEKAEIKKEYVLGEAVVPEDLFSVKLA